MSDATAATPAPQEWRGRFLEDFALGDVYRSRIGRTGLSVRRDAPEVAPRFPDPVSPWSVTAGPADA